MVLKLKYIVVVILCLFWQLLQESERQLNSLLCFDLAWFSSSDTPIVNMPTWELQKQDVEKSIPQIQLKHTGIETL